MISEAFEKTVDVYKSSNIPEPNELSLRDNDRKMDSLNMDLNLMIKSIDPITEILFLSKQFQNECENIDDIKTEPITTLTRSMVNILTNMNINITTLIDRFKDIGDILYYEK